jgi:hypothetical protein
MHRLTRALPDRIKSKSRVETHYVEPRAPEDDEEGNVRPEVVAVGDSVVGGEGCEVGCGGLVSF